MVSKELVRELIGNYSGERFVRVLKQACAPASFVSVDKDFTFKEAGDVKAKILGIVKNLQGESGLVAPLLVADIPLDTALTERSSRIRQFKLAKKVLEHFAANPPMELAGVITQGIFAFHDAEGRFRVSLVTAAPEKGKFNWSKARRQSFYVTNDPDANATFVQRMCMDWSTLKGIKDAFSVEKLTKEFYNQLFAWYERACDDKRVEYPNGLDTDADNREDNNRKHLIRLITRLMFVWFLKQKKLVPDSLFDESELKRILKDFDPVGREQHQYYRAILQNLFFATLNSEIDERGFADAPGARHPGEKVTTRHHGVKTKYRYASEFAISKQKVLDLFRPVPFLNGGLFECLDQEADDGKVMYYDGFSQQEHHRDRGTLTWAHVPNDLFFDPDYGIIPLLKRYNFTVEENSPGDEDVALDPELLGKVFENLLGAFNPETKEIARNTTGSFYTPREIVNYMVDESLVAYLAGGQAAGNDSAAKNAKGAKTDETVVRELVVDGKCPTDEALCKRLVKAIETAKILDPACGSGAFPMGALLKMVELLRILKKLPEDANLYDLKLKLIENCIFGSDIQEIAVQISKLRIFISLVCEQKPDVAKPNYGINTLPNLETKFVAANSLIGLQKEKGKVTQSDLFFDSGEIQKTKDALWDVRHRHFLAKTRREKNELRRQDKELREKLAAAAKRTGYSEESTRLMALWDPYNQNVHAEFFDPEWMFNVKDGFDIVIGNPPYISAPMQIADHDLKRQREYLANDPRFKCLVQKWDLYIAFIELSLRHLLRVGGNFTMIVPYPLANQTYGAKLRQMIVSKFAIRQLVDLQGVKVFENATVTNCIPFIVKAAPLEKVPIVHIGEDGEFTVAEILTLSEFMPDDKTCVWKTVKEENLLARFTTLHTLGEYCYISEGMKLNANEQIAKGEFTKEDLISDTKDKIHCREYVEGKDVDRYVLKGRPRYLEYGTARVPSKLRRPTFKAMYDEPKLMFNILGEMRCLTDYSRLLHSTSIISAVPWWSLRNVFNGSISKSEKNSHLTRKDMEILSETCNLKYLAGIFNSRFAQILLNSIRGGDYHIYANYLRAIPVPTATAKQQSEIIFLVDRILAAKKRNPAADTSALEREIDEKVYRLYGLTDDEIRVVDGKDKEEGSSASKVRAQHSEQTLSSDGGARSPSAPKKRKPKIVEEF